jgi:hypothetical protein
VAVAVKTAKVTAKRVAKPRAAAVKVAANAAVKALVKAADVPDKVFAKPFMEPKHEKPGKAKKPKLVRDSFTIPKVEYTVLEDLKHRAAHLSSPAKKSELIRAGIMALAAMSNAEFLVALKAVPAIKTGRPAKE